MIRRRSHSRSLLLLPALLLLAGCEPGAQKVPETSLELRSIVEAVPDAPVPADEGMAGVWEALPGLDAPARAFVVAPEASPRDGLLLVHPGWGVSERVRDLARRMADEGFTVVAPDIYEGVASTNRLSREPLIKGVEPGRASELIAAAQARLEDAGFDAGARAALGVGVGGNWLTLALDDGLEAALYVLDTTLVAAENLPDSLGGRSLVLLVGEHNNSFGQQRLESMGELVSTRDGTLEVRLIAAAGTTLLDERAIGFSGVAYEYAIEALLEMSEEELRAREG